MIKEWVDESLSIEEKALMKGVKKSIKRVSGIEVINYSGKAIVDNVLVEGVKSSTKDGKISNGYLTFTKLI